MDKLALRDLTDAAAGPHAMQILVDTVCGLWPVPVRKDPGSRIVTVSENYDRLRYPASAVTREARYSHYLPDGRMLRSHTTARIPALLDETQEETVLAVPGICYRRDVIDRHHVGEPHQMDLWRIRPHAPMTEDELEAMIARVVEAVLPGRPWHTVPNIHPYTLRGREIYVDGVEIGECGLAHPDVLGDKRGGLAMGLGLDRLLMLIKGIPDIRLLRAGDPRVADQMLDLAPYRPVSAQPPVRRDLSLAVAQTLDAELLGDRVRETLRDDAESVEEIEVISQTPYAELNDSAIRRMGVHKGQKNVLLRLVLRHPTRTLTAAEANLLRDRVYAGLHEGAAHEWAAPAAAMPTEAA
jgi:phenylalanyl-tRNA synthetase alpha chain